MRGLALLTLFSWLLAPAVVWAVIETYQFSSPDFEARYHTLSQELRCPKCQNQNIADSNAPIARDLRVVLYEQCVHDLCNVFNGSACLDNMWGNKQMKQYKKWSHCKFILLSYFINN